MNKVDLPYNFASYRHQESFFGAMLAGKKRASLCWHRRAGKDLCAWVWAIYFCLTTQGSLVYHCLPTQAQARKVIWDGRTNGGEDFFHFIPESLVERKLSNTMMIEFKNGSILQLIGSDNYDRVVGTNPSGINFSEWSLCDPAAYDYFRPILRANKEDGKGWCTFEFTARGRNHAYRSHMAAIENENWYAETVDVTQTVRHDGKPIISQEDIEEDRIEGMEEAKIQSEYYCSFDAPIEGAWWGPEMVSLHNSNRIGDHVHDAELLVHTTCDLGYDDNFTWIFFQTVGKSVYIIDYYQNSREGLPHYIKMLKDKGKDNKYEYGKHFAPHDVKQHDWTSDKSKQERAKKMGIKFTDLPKLSTVDQCDAARGLLRSNCFFNENTTFKLIDCLTGYSKKRDGKKVNEEGKPLYTEKPVHSWHSHGADSFKLLAVSLKYADEKRRARRQNRRSNTKQDPYSHKRDTSNVYRSQK